MILAYTDGSSRGNPGPGGWAAVVHAGDRVAELGGHESHTTNNRMELMGAIGALEWIAAQNIDDSITMKCDSKYVIQGITAWVKGWKRNGWITAGKKEVGNRDLWERLDAVASGLSIKWDHVDGHVGIAGNERCDEIATGFADGNPSVLYIGDFAKYSIDLHAMHEIPGAKEKKSRVKKVGPAYSYLSLIGGELEKHKTWAECEARVKGKRGAKFRKTMSAADEAAVIAEWGM